MTKKKSPIIFCSGKLKTQLKQSEQLQPVKRSFSNKQVHATDNACKASSAKQPLQ